MEENDIARNGQAESTETKTSKNKQNKSNYKSVKTKSYVNKNLNSEKMDFQSLSHEQLLVEATRLQSHVFQLKNLLNKSNENKTKSSNEPYLSKKRNQKQEIIESLILVNTIVDMFY